MDSWLKYIIMQWWLLRYKHQRADGLIRNFIIILVLSFFEILAPIDYNLVWMSWMGSFWYDLAKYTLFLSENWWKNGQKDARKLIAINPKYSFLEMPPLWSFINVHGFPWQPLHGVARIKLQVVELFGLETLPCGPTESPMWHHHMSRWAKSKAR